VLKVICVRERISARSHKQLSPAGRTCFLDPTCTVSVIIPQRSCTLSAIARRKTCAKVANGRPSSSQGLVSLVVLKVICVRERISARSHKQLSPAGRTCSYRKGAVRSRLSLGGRHAQKWQMGDRVQVSRRHTMMTDTVHSHKRFQGLVSLVVLKVICVRERISARSSCRCSHGVGNGPQVGEKLALKVDEFLQTGRIKESTLCRARASSPDRNL
jgi:hypothetical protein